MTEKVTLHGRPLSIAGAKRYYYVDFQDRDVSLGSDPSLERMSNEDRVALARRYLREEGRGHPGKVVKIYSATYPEGDFHTYYEAPSPPSLRTRVRGWFHAGRARGTHHARTR
jgi:hypothetical protein